jgi:hypothetical protein
VVRACLPSTLVDVYFAVVADVPGIAAAGVAVDEIIAAPAIRASLTSTLVDVCLTVGANVPGITGAGVAVDEVIATPVI